MRLLSVLTLTILGSINLFAQDFSELTDKGTEAYIAADYETAADYFKQAIEADPSRGVGYHNYGYTLALLGDLDEGIKLISQAIDMDPDSMTYVLNRGELLYYAYDYEASIVDFSTYISAMPSEPNGYFSRAMANLELANDAEVAADLDKAESLYEEVPAEVYWLRAKMYNYGRDYVKAIQQASKAIQLAPEWLDPVFVRAQAFYNAGKYEQSVKDYDTYLSVNDWDDIAFSNRGLAKSSLGDYSGALSDYAKAIELYDQDAIVYLNRASAYRELNQNSDALSDLNKAAELMPDYERIFNNRASLHAEMEIWSSAISDYSKALQLEPNSLDNLMGRSTCYLKADQDAKAYEDSQAILQIDSENNNGYLNGATALFNLDRYDEALSLVNTGLSKIPDDGMLYYIRSAIYKEMGEDSKAAADDAKAKELLTY